MGEQNSKYRSTGEDQLENGGTNDIPLTNHNRGESDEQDLSSKLRRAAAGRNVTKVKRLLDENADPTRCDRDGRNSLHHACRHEMDESTDIEKLLSLLFEKFTASEINAADKKDNTALWYAIRYRNSRAAIMLVNQGADFFKSKEKEDVNTALHEACLAGLHDVVDKMIYYGTNRGTNPVEWRGHLKATPLHAACKNSHLTIVKMLINKKADILAEDKYGKTPLHAAASGVKVDGTIETVDFLLKHGAMKILNKPSSEEESKTPLSTACFYGHYETAKFLLEKGAIVDTNCLKYAVEKDFSYTARVLVQSSQWRKCLRQILPNGEPILNEIIRRMPEVAVDILDKCTVQRLRRLDEEGCVAFNFEFLECFKEKGALFENEAQGVVSDYVDDPAGLAKHHAKKDIAQKEKEFEDVVKQRKRSFGPKWGLKTFNKSQHPLTVIAKSEDYRLLTHPVVRALLHYKWVPYGFAYYLTNLFIFLLFLVFATSFSLTLELPFSQDCPGQGNGTCNVPERKRNAVITLGSLAILFAVIRLLMRLGREIFLMYTLRGKYFISINVLIDWTDVPSYVFIIIFATIPYRDCPCPEVWQWQIGIIGLFLAWLTLLKFANKFPIISKYILMFWRITETFGKVALSIGIPLVLAFAWPFYMALFDPDVSRSPFQNPGISIVKVISMTAGSANYDNIFRLDSSGVNDEKVELPFLPVTYILWIIFVILMPLLLNYLLVGLAIGDIKSVEEHAELRKLALKVKLVLEFEEILPSKLRSKLRRGHKVVYPWKPKKLKWKMFEKEHESPDALEQVFERAEHQARKYNGKQVKDGHDHHHHTDHPVKHISGRRYNIIGREESHYSELQERLERVEDLLERMAEKLNVPL